MTLNDRLDYFGTTVNLAARLQDKSEGEDLILSANLMDDPAVAPLLEGLPLTAEAAAADAIIVSGSPRDAWSDTPEVLGMLDFVQGAASRRR